MVQNGKEIRENELMDYYYYEILEEDNKLIKKKKKVRAGIT